MTSPRTGKAVANQFIIIDSDNNKYFQSYESVIVKIPRFTGYTVVNAIEGEIDTRIQLDETYWNYSKTTSKYRNEFLGETTKETQEKINNGTYKLANLN